MPGFQPPDSPEKPDLDAAFARLREATPPAPRSFLEEALAGALSEMPAPKPRPRPRPGSRFGSWPAALALSGAAFAGLTVGYLDPAALSTVAGSALASDDTCGVTFEDPFSALLSDAEL